MPPSAHEGECTRKCSIHSNQYHRVSCYEIPLLLLISVPSVPENLNVTNVLANQFTLEWDPPFFPNGIIQFYVVFVQGLATLNQVPANFFVTQQILTLDLSLNISAMPYSFYAVDVGAVTNAGLGDLSKPNVLTAEAREFACMHNFGSAVIGIMTIRNQAYLPLLYLVCQLYSIVGSSISYYNYNFACLYSTVHPHHNNNKVTTHAVGLSVHVFCSGAWHH